MTLANPKHPLTAVSEHFLKKIDANSYENNLLRRTLERVVQSHLRL